MAGAAVKTPRMPRRNSRPIGGPQLFPPQQSAEPAVSSPDESAEYRQLLETSHELVVNAVRFVASRHRLNRETSDELRSRVMLHLCANDYGVLRQWRRECNLHTFLVTVITRVFLDYRNAEWGKAKPPALARRGGPDAMLLWTLTHRKRLSFDEAVNSMHTQHGVTATRDALWALYAQFPPPSGRYFVAVAELAGAPHPDGAADGQMRAAGHQSVAERVERALAVALDRLDAPDRLIVKLFFADGLTRAQIARLLRLDQQRLYPHFLRLLSRLASALVAQGVQPGDVREIVGEKTVPWRDVIAEAAIKDAAVPSLHTAGPPPASLRPRTPIP
jgi:RNA polymerase sigma factor (sigma-70 family)